MEARTHDSKTLQLEDDVRSLHLKIKQYKSNIVCYKRQKNLADDAILDMQAKLDNYQAEAACKESDDEYDDQYDEDEVAQEIMDSSNSAAAIVCHLLRGQDNSPAWVEDVTGVVATLATVEDDNLSRVLSKYLGMETMLAVVCKTLSCASDLESVADTSSGIRGYGASIGRPVEDQFAVICLEKMRPYLGDFVANDPQRRLDLLKPRLPTGETPPGFLGFAVNMINIERTNLQFVAPNGHGLRETLFFHLFSHLQVYQTRQDVLQALPVIRASAGAISLDGGIVDGGIFKTWPMERQELGLRFPKCSKKSNLPEVYFDIEMAMKEKKWRREKLVKDMRREQLVLNQAKSNYKIKKQDYAEALLQMGPSYAASQNGFEQEP